MAQTKTKKAKASRSTAASSGASSKTARKPKAASKARSHPRRSSNRSKSASHNNKSSNGVEGGAKAVRDAVSNAGDEAGQAIRKAKIPLLAGGAALAGTVGGVVIGSTHSGGKVLGINLPKPKRVKIRSKDLAKAAKGVGRFGENIGELTAEFRRVREGLAGGDGKQNSPLEILLKGLTTRR
jgi:hypothetical protein